MWHACLICYINKLIYHTARHYTQPAVRSNSASHHCHCFMAHIPATDRAICKIYSRDTSKQFDTSVLKGLQAGVLSDVGAFNPQDVSTTLWSLAQYPDDADRAVIKAVLTASERLLGRFNAQDLANTAWALHKLGDADSDQQAFVALLTRQLHQSITLFSTQQLVQILSFLSSSTGAKDGLRSSIEQRLNAKAS